MNTPATVTTRRPGPTWAAWLAYVPAMLVGAGFLVATLLVAVLPALAVAYIVVGFAVRDVVVVFVLWGASAAVTVALFLAISRVSVRTMDGFLDRDLPATGPSED